jgi:hypothetical protein
LEYSSPIIEGRGIGGKSMEIKIKPLEKTTGMILGSSSTCFG